MQFDELPLLFLMETILITTKNCFTETNNVFSAARVMKEQEQHQIKPPGAADVDLHEQEGLGHQKLGQDMIGLVGCFLNVGEHH